MRALNTFLLALLLWAGSLFAYALESEPQDTGKVVASLVSSHDTVAPGDEIILALRTVLDAHWHTYWRNPGDSGEPVYIEWHLPEEITAQGELFWPLPMTLPTGPIINYGFEGEPLFPQNFKISETAAIGTELAINADVYYLVCKDVCIPEQAKLSFVLPVGESLRDESWIYALEETIDVSPKTGAITGGIAKAESSVTMALTGFPAGADLSEAYFFPFAQGVINHSQAQEVRVGEQGVSLETLAEYLWDGDMPDTLSGVVAYGLEGQRVGTEVALSVGQLPDIGLAAVPAQSGGDVSITFIGAIIGALIGGLILNLMPCVFPVISIKALSIAKAAHGERKVIKREAWIYTAGVLVTFLALTLILLAFKAGGSEIGWGFQLQSPKLVAGLALLLFAIGLNLLGVFEIGTGLQNTGAELTQKQGVAGSFFTGVLAVVVATPCTAPFMAGAIGYALAQPAFVTLAVFMALGLGFALPFLLIAYVPALVSRLPKPGPWMVRFREILAFPMFGAAIWLVWVLSLQAGDQGVLAVLSAMLLLALAIWLFKRTAKWVKLLGAISLLAAIALPVSLSTAQVDTELTTQSWSPERVAQMQAEGRPVFVDFTAAWCVTCKVNERLVLDTKEAHALFNDTNTAFLIADWTNKNDEIARELARHGRSGVPLYLVYSADEKMVTPEILPQILTYNVIEEALRRAQNP